MPGSASAEGTATDLVAGWVYGRSVARRVALPVSDHGGWRVDTASPTEVCRYIFADPTPDVAALAREINQPQIWIKVCCEDSALAACLPSEWTLAATSWMMVGEGSFGALTLPAGYRANVVRDGVCVEVSILAPDGALAASGHAAEAGGVFVYDRIVTDAAHRRRGLGRALMHFLSAQRQSADAQQVLVATEAGRALYESLGWRVYRPYASAVIPDPAA
ncbi:GNAT family N-acetyltransferase [Sphingomonas sp. MMS24-J45]|uniref:GNAT family N-acetyltransferase n=1 Tax=Sphingomonas sp. MMS24-J45 TaxID=3238806 RepID=UPI0038508114